MARVSFTPNLRRHLSVEDLEVSARTVREALEEAFTQYPNLRSYLLDDQARLRQHVNLFLDNQVIQDRVTLSDAVQESSEIWVIQALSGG